MEKFNTTELRANQEQLQKILSESSEINEDDMEKLHELLVKEIESTNKLDEYYKNFPINEKKED